MIKLLLGFYLLLLSKTLAFYNDIAYRMKKQLFGFIFHKILGWKAEFKVDIPEKCILCVAPHTSNWDLLMGKLFYGAYNKKASFMMKKEWFTFPLGYFFRSIGGIPVHRGKKNSLVDQMSKLFEEKKQFNLAITPEGTRKPNPNWKKGFYYIACGAKVPIILIGIDYTEKKITVGKEFIPSGDIEKDMPIIKDFFKDFKGKIPSNFKY